VAVVEALIAELAVSLVITAIAPTRALNRPPSESEMIAKARLGDPAAFEEIVRTYLPRVLAIAQNLVGRGGDAEDVAQEVFFKVHQKLANFREEASLYTWLYRVTVNTATDFMKRRSHRPLGQVEEIDTLPVADQGDTPLSAISRADLSREIREAILEIPGNFRTVLVLREIEQLTYEEIAQTMKCSIGTVESRLFRARARLKAILERRFREQRSARR
jgi:RNA polymerase sigma-70 factor, ECF subfamily